MAFISKESTRKASYEALIKLFPRVQTGVAKDRMIAHSLPTRETDPMIVTEPLGRLSPAALPEVSQAELDEMEDEIAAGYLREAISLSAASEAKKEQQSG